MDFDRTKLRDLGKLTLQEREQVQAMQQEMLAKKVPWKYEWTMREFYTEYRDKVLVPRGIKVPATVEELPDMILRLQSGEVSQNASQVRTGGRKPGTKPKKEGTPTLPKVIHPLKEERASEPPAPIVFPSLTEKSAPPPAPKITEGEPTLGGQLKYWRGSDISREAAAEMAEVSFFKYGQWENDHERPSQNQLEDIMENYKVPEQERLSLRKLREVPPLNPLTRNR